MSSCNSREASKGEALLKQTLMIIDAQQELLEGNDQTSAVYLKDGLIENINQLIKQATAQSIPIVFVRDLDVAGGQGEGFEIHKEIQVPKDARVFDKAATNAFYGTGLLEHLQSEEVGHLIIMGCETPHCIDSAVRTATINGFDVTLIADGHSTIDNDVLLAEQIISHHNHILHGHYNVDHFSIVRKAEETVFEPTHDTYRTE